MTETQLFYFWVYSLTSPHITALFSTLPSLGLSLHGQYLLYGNSKISAEDSVSPLGSSPRRLLLETSQTLARQAALCVTILTFLQVASMHFTTSYVPAVALYFRRTLTSRGTTTGKTFSIRQIIKQKTTQISRSLLMSNNRIHQLTSLGKNLELSCPLTKPETKGKWN